MYLVTGTKSGLGKYLQRQLSAASYTRQDNLASIQAAMQEPFSAIIHCAFNVNRGITAHSLQAYLQDNLLLTQQLLNLPHKKFIFISTSDVYPRELRVWKENDDYPIDQVDGLYGLSKLMAENVIKAHTDNYLILRPTALLGHDARPNSLIKVLNENQPTLTLAATSKFNYILHADILNFIQYALENDVCGVFNLAAKTNIALGDVATHFKRPVNFGSYIYQVANVCNQKVAELCPDFSHSSLENIERFLSTQEK